MFNPSEFWKIFTDFIVVLAILDLVALFAFALCQWVRRKSFRKIDRALRWFALPVALMGATYLFFEKILVISYRPAASGHPEEPSFPSTHVMITATIFFATMALLPRYVKNRRTRLWLDAAMLVATLLIAIGRVLAHMHWVTDVIGGLVFAAIFAVIYTLILRHPTSKNPPTL